jgi:hypothetical protein
MKIILYDALSAFRVRMEREPGTMFLRGVINETRLPDLRVYVWDGPGGNKARRDLFPAYKTKREYKPGVIQDMGFVRELLSMTPSWQVRIPGFEGDDVIAALVQHFLITTDMNIEIVCRDGDIAALCALSPRVSSNYTMKDVPVADIQLYKVCVGDPADCIPGIKGFGKGAWAGADKAGLRKLIDRLADTKAPLTSEDESWALAIGLGKASFNWLCVQANIDELLVMRRIIDFLPIPADVLSAHLIKGTDQPEALAARMKEFRL